MTDLRSVAVMFVLLFALGIGILVMLKTSEVIVVAMENSTMSSYPHVNDSLQSSISLPRQYSDTIFIGIFFAFTISLLILGYFISAYPIFIMIYIIGLVVIALVSAILTYVWDNIAQSSTFLPYLSYIPVTNFVLRHLVIFVTIIGFISIIVMYIGNTRRMGG
jgi:hypothetical protein